MVQRPSGQPVVLTHYRSGGWNALPGGNRRPDADGSRPGSSAGVLGDPTLGPAAFCAAFSGRRFGQDNPVSHAWESPGHYGAPRGIRFT